MSKHQKVYIYMPSPCKEQSPWLQRKSICWHSFIYMDRGETFKPQTLQSIESNKYSINNPECGKNV